MTQKLTPKTSKRPRQTVVMLSGGIDSTAALWQVLNHPDGYGQVHVHHIHIQSIERRWRAEAEAVKVILAYMREHAPTPFTSSESSFNLPHLGNKFLFDAEITAFMSGYMTSRDPSITKVIVGATATDFAMGASQSVRRGQAIHNAFHPEAKDHNTAVKDFILSKLTKEEVFKTLPPDLAALTWSCRTPSYVNGKPVECGLCKTCTRELPAIQRQKSTLGTQQDYWNSRVKVWDSLGEPLIPNQEELEFQRRHIVPGGDTLVLGVTPQLMKVALEVSGTVTSVDYAKDVIKAKRMDGVQYICTEWNEFFRQNSQTFDSIVTDGGLVCLDYPKTWQEIADNIYTHLKPQGVFAARIYVSSDIPAQESYADKNLNRLVPAMASLDANYAHRMQTPPFKHHEVWYTFPPEPEVLRTFERLELVEMLVPEYEEGQRFVSHAWRRS